MIGGEWFVTDVWDMYVCLYYIYIYVHSDVELYHSNSLT